MTLPVRASLSVCIVAIVMALPQAAQGPRIRFTDVTSSSGLASFINVSGTPTKDFITDANGNGVAFFDYDADRDLDVLLVNGSTLQALVTGGHQMVALYRNDGARFTDVTKASGLTRRGWGTGVCIADYDNDGFEDVYVTA